jgi:hypothetical protein
MVHLDTCSCYVLWDERSDCTWTQHWPSDQIFGIYMYYSFINFRSFNIKEYRIYPKLFLKTS